MKCFIAFILLLCSLHINAYSKSKSEGISSHTKEQLYSQGLNLIAENKTKKAAEKFQQVSNLYPFSDIGIKSLVMSAFLYYLNGDYLDATLSSENYIRFYWQTQEVEYMYYLKAMSYFMKIRNTLSTPEYSMKAKESFEELIAKFPNSKYVKSSLDKLSQVNEGLAGYEINIAKFYMKKGNYASSIPRLQYIATEYPNSEIFKEANYRMVEAYCILGIASEAKAYFEILKKNSPQSEWARYAANVIKNCN